MRKAKRDTRLRPWRNVALALTLLSVCLPSCGALITFRSEGEIESYLAGNPKKGTLKDDVRFEYNWNGWEQISVDNITTVLKRWGAIDGTLTIVNLAIGDLSCLGDANVKYVERLSLPNAGLTSLSGIEGTKVNFSVYIADSDNLLDVAGLGVSTPLMGDLTLVDTGVRDFVGSQIAAFADDARIFIEDCNIQSFDGLENTTGTVELVTEDMSSITDIDGLRSLKFRLLSLVELRSLSHAPPTPIRMVGWSPTNGAHLWLSEGTPATGSLVITGTDVDSIYVYGFSSASLVDISVNATGLATVVVGDAGSAAVNFSNTRFTEPSINALTLIDCASAHFEGLFGNVSVVYGGLTLDSVVGLASIAELSKVFANDTQVTSDYYASTYVYDRIKSEFSSSPSDEVFSQLKIANNPNLVSLRGIEEVMGIFYGDVIIDNNAALVSVTALRSGIDAIAIQPLSRQASYGNLVVSRNPSLVQFAMLDLLYCSDVYLVDNANLLNASLPVLHTIGGTFTFTDNPLVSCDFVNDLLRRVEVWGAIHFADGACVGPVTVPCFPQLILPNSLEPEPPSATHCNATVAPTASLQAEVTELLINATGYAVPYTVCLLPGTYTGLTTGIGFRTCDGGPVHLLGAGQNETFVDLGGIGRLANVGENSVAYISELSVANGATFNLWGGFLYAFNATTVITNVRVANCLDVAAYVTGGRVSIIGSTFTGNAFLAATGSYQGSGVIDFVGESVTVINSTFSDNTGHTGAAISIANTPELTVIGSVFVENMATVSGGGAIAAKSSGSVFIRGSTFKNNVATGQQYGGAVYTLSCDSLVVSYSVFKGGTARRGGGFASEATVDVVVGNSTFDGLSTSSRGGGGYVRSVSFVSLVGSTFVNNTSHEGGGVYMETLGPSSRRYIITDNVAASNTAFHGAFLHLDRISSYYTWFANCSVVNSDGGDSGAVRLYRSRMDVSDSYFEGNSAVGGSSLHAHSHSYIVYHAAFAITNCVFVNNYGSSYAGGVLCSRNSWCTIAGSVFSGNSGGNAGAAVTTRDNPNFVDITNTSFIDGRSEEYGGGVYSASNNYRIEDCTFDNNFVNSGGGGGGGVYSTAGGTIKSSTFRDNTAYSYGGSITVHAGTIDNCTFHGGLGFYGGAIAVRDDGVTTLTVTTEVTRCSFVYSFGYFGGVVYATQMMRLDGVSFSGSLGPYGGGDIYVNDMDGIFYLSNSTHTASSAQWGSGGALRLYVLSAEVSNSTFVSTYAYFSGGTIEATEVWVTDSTFTDSTATYYDGGAINTGSGGLERCALLRTSAPWYGGAVSANSLRLRDCSFDSHSSENGGAVSIAPVDSTSVIDFDGCSFYNCSATENGGAVRIIEDSLPPGVLPDEPHIASGCTFNRNSAAFGGGFYTEVGVRVSGSSFVDHYAHVGGSIVFAGAGGELLDSTIADSTAVGLGGGVFVFFSSSLYMSRVAISTSFPDCAYSLLSYYFDIHNCVFDVEPGAYGVDVTGPFRLTLNNSVLSVPSSGFGLRTYSVSDVAISGSFLSKDTSASPSHVLQCTDSAVDIESSVLCTSGAAEPVNPINCASTCTVSGAAGYKCNNAPFSFECTPACAEGDYCVPNAPMTTAPNLGCFECISPCWDRSDTCDWNSTICVDDGSGSYHCDCKPGFVDNTGTSCSDFDECAESTHDCVSPAFCVNEPGSFWCDCPAGYDRVVDSTGAVQCNNIDECVVFPGICGATGLCIDSVGSFQCVCQPGYFEVFGYTECIRCPPGNYIADDGDQDDCLPCPVNTYNNATDSTECLPCTVFSTTVGQTGSRACECDSGFVFDQPSGLCLANCSLGELRVEDYACVPCPLGTYGSAPSECDDCPPPTTTFSTGLLECECETGYIVVANGTDCALTCGPGWFVEPVNELCLLCPANTYKNTTSTAESCTPCPLTGQTSLGGSDDLADCVCSGGLAPNWALGKCDLFCQPGTSRPVPYTECYACGTGYYSDAVNLEECTACPRLTTAPTQSDSLDDCWCEEGAYRPDGARGLPCRKCPFGGKCAGKANQPIARAGFYPAGSGNFVECVPYAACAEGGECNEGYGGDRCAKCEHNYHRVNGECRPCGAIATISLIVAVVLMVVFCVCLFAYNYRGADTIAFPSLFIGLNALQVVAEYGKLTAAWPPVFRSILDVLSLVSFSVEFIAPECVASGGNAFVLRFALTMLIPVAVAAGYGLCYAVYLAVAQARALAPDTTASVRRSVLQSGMQLLLIFYLPVSAAVFGFFDCIDSGTLADDGETAVFVVRSSPDIVCRGEVWNRALPFAIASLILYPIAAPLAFGSVLISSFWRLGDDFFVKFGYLVNRYRPELFCYEIAILIRKIVLVLLITFISGSGYIRAGAAVAWLLFTFIIHIRLQPYSYTHHNDLESACVMLVCVLLQEGVMLRDGTWGEVVKDAIMVFTILVLFVVIAGGVAWDIMNRSEVVGQANRKTRLASSFYQGVAGFNMTLESFVGNGQEGYGYGAGRGGGGGGAGVGGGGEGTVVDACAFDLNALGSASTFATMSTIDGGGGGGRNYYADTFVGGGSGGSDSTNNPVWADNSTDSTAGIAGGVDYLYTGADRLRGRSTSLMAHAGTRNKRNNGPVLAPSILASGSQDDSGVAYDHSLDDFNTVVPPPPVCEDDDNNLPLPPPPLHLPSVLASTRDGVDDNGCGENASASEFPSGYPSVLASASPSESGMSVNGRGASSQLLALPTGDSGACGGGDGCGEGGSSEVSSTVVGDVDVSYGSDANMLEGGGVDFE